MRKHLAVAAAMVTLAGGVTLASAGSAASASGRSLAPSGVINHSCGPKVDPNRFPYRWENRHAYIGSTRISLRGGTMGSGKPTYQWALITKARVGDTVWLDWSDSPGSWHQCGPYKVRTGHDKHTPAVNFVIDSHGSREMRACGHHAGKTKCTEWTP